LMFESSYAKAAGEIDVGSFSVSEKLVKPELATSIKSDRNKKTLILRVAYHQQLAAALKFHLEEKVQKIKQVVEQADVDTIAAELFKIVTDNSDDSPEL
jgi:molybdopterin-guanine dinucleotide biosynthesis protein A